MGLSEVALQQVIYSYGDEGGISKMLANHLGTTAAGNWVLPVWREMGGQQACNMHPELHGAAGVLLSSNQAGVLLPGRHECITYCLS